MFSKLSIMRQNSPNRIVGAGMGPMTGPQTKYIRRRRGFRDRCCIPGFRKGHDGVDQRLFIRADLAG